MSIQDAARALRMALNSPKRSRVSQFIEWCLEKFVNEKNLGEAIDSRTDLITLSLNHYGVGHSKIVTPLARIVFKLYWDEVESYLTNPEKVRQVISKKPGCREPLYTDRGVEYLNWCCENSYNKLYDFIWLGL